MADLEQSNHFIERSELIERGPNAGPIDDQLDYGGTSSVGVEVWPPAEGASFNRAKGINLTAIDSIERLRKELDYILEYKFDEQNTRITGRLIIERSLLEEVYQSYPEILEGIMSLEGAGIEALDSYVIIYVGKNHESRLPDPEDLKDQLERAVRIFQGENIKDIVPELASRTEEPVNILTNPRIFELKEEDKRNPVIIESYAKLNEVFGWNYEQCLEILNNPNNVVVVCMNGDEMVGSGVAEKFAWKVKLPDGTICELKGAELTEATTGNNYRGNGIYSKVSRKELEVLARLGMNLVYGESNLSSFTVLLAAYKQGRRLGLPLDLIVDKMHALMHHVTINGMYQNFAPTYMTLRELLSIISKET